MSDAPERAALGGHFDRVWRSLHGIPDAVPSKATTLRHTSPILELAQTFIVQTVRQRDVGDYVFVEYVGAEGSVRIVLPPEVADVIARQRDVLTTKNRSRAAKQRAAADKAAGKVPGFMRGKPKKKGK